MSGRLCYYLLLLSGNTFACNYHVPGVWFVVTGCGVCVESGCNVLQDIFVRLEVQITLLA